MSFRTKLKDNNYENKMNKEKYTLDYEINNNKTENYYKEKNIDEVIKAFDYFDINNNGKIQIREMKRVLSYFGDRMTEEEINKIFRVLGIDKINNENIEYMKLIDFLINSN